MRSASFDEIQLEAARGPGGGGLLAVPQPGARSRSFDSAGSDDSGTYLEVKTILDITAVLTAARIAFSFGAIPQSHRRYA